MTERHPKWVRLDALLDGELVEGPAQEVRNHVAACTECAAHLNESSALGDLLAEEPPPLPLAVVTRMQARALAAHAPVPPLWWLAVPRTWWLGFAALVLLAVTAGVLVSPALVPPADPSFELAAVLTTPELSALLGEPQRGNAGFVAPASAVRP